MKWRRVEPLPWCEAHHSLWITEPGPQVPQWNSTDGPNGNGTYPDGWCVGVDRYEWHLRQDCIREDPPQHWATPGYRPPWEDE